MYGVYPFFLFSLTAFAHIFLKAHFDKKKIYIPESRSNMVVHFYELKK